MDNSLASWQALMRRQWPVAVALGVLLFAELISTGPTRNLIALPPAMLLAAIAVISPRRPVDAAFIGAAMIVGTSLGYHLLGTDTYSVFSPVSPSETASLMVLIAMVIRFAPARWSTSAVMAIWLSGLVASLTRPRNVMGDWRLANFDEAFPTFMLFALAVGTGLYFRARDRDRQRTVTHQVTSAQQQERIALARELHDVVAHHVTGIVVQAQAAMIVADKDPQAAQRILPSIARSGSDALTAMRRLVGTLRDSDARIGVDAAESATADLAADVRKVVEDAREIGPPIELRIDLRAEVPAEVARSVLRLVQEALTNAHKHALNATVIKIDVTSEPGRTRVVVADDGQGSAHDPIGGSGGYGLVGMRERVELLGGRFSAGRGWKGGWEVFAELPVGEAKQ
ncbi:histidine kinase [Allokutzneria sp. A3M-2-11 16]|uniref:sensor histidine kinase n=1 Tax=Allokutzneria sp. A3M-2-11 16 TaxID=2962043 RepID=UPI0020B69075|nr:histidine kinase [Allokutzneria sp. A3M-2-11 16]MCP3799080.1 histidine kinase [Allokutzneria sp. A3M-2-11 16]